MNGSQKPQKTRLKFAAMVGVYFFGSLNDNFYRQCALLLAVAANITRLESYILESFIMSLFALPFVLFASYAGFLADRFSKRSVIIAARIFAVIAFIIGAVGLYLLNWPIIIATIFILGLQSTIFSPAINGTIPELYSDDYVVTANGIVRTVTNAAILLGIASAGFVLDADAKGAHGDIPIGRFLAAGFVLTGALTALVVSFFLPRFPAASSEARFPLRAPWEAIVTLFSTRRDPLLAISMFAKAFFWFAGSLQILIINPLGLKQFHLTKTHTSVLITVELVGIAVGSLLAPVFAKGPRWHRVLAPSAAAMAGSMFAIALVPFLPVSTRTSIVVGSLALLGMSAGVFTIPTTSFVQTKPAPDLKGRMIAASNLADFMGILLSGAVFYLLNLIGFRPSNCFAAEAVMVMAVAGWLMLVLPRVTANPDLSGGAGKESKNA